MLTRTSKLQAAEDQLIAAIDFYFNTKNAVSTHTLASASHEILDRICAHRGLQRGVLQQGSLWIKPEMKKIFWKKVTEAKNFFKHADTDPEPEATLEWNPELSSHYILDAVMLYRRLKPGRIPCELISFQIWYRINHPEMWSEEATEFDSIFRKAKDLMKNISKQEFYSLMLEACKANPDYISSSK